MPECQIGVVENGSFTVKYEIINSVLQKCTSSTQCNKLCIITVVGNTKGKSTLLNFMIQFLRNIGDQNWIRNEFGNEDGFSFGSSNKTNGVYIWDEVFTLKTSDQQSIAILLIDTPSTNDLFPEGVRETFHNFVINFSTTLIVNLAEDDQDEEGKELLFECLKSTDGGYLKQLHLLVQNCEPGKLGKVARKKCLADIADKYHLNPTCFGPESFAQSCTRMPKLVLDPLQEFNGQLLNSANNFFVEYLEKFITELFNPDNLEEQCPSIEDVLAQTHKLSTITTKEENPDKEPMEVLDAEEGTEETWVEDSNQTEQFTSDVICMKHLRTSYNIYVEMMQSLRRTHGLETRSITLQLVDETHTAAAGLASDIFFKECQREPNLTAAEIQLYQTLLTVYISSYKSYFSARLSIETNVEKVSREQFLNTAGKWSFLKDTRFIIPDKQEDLESILMQYQIFGAGEFLLENKAIVAAFNAHSKNLSPNTAYMYLLGASGSGKSSTVNFLFGKKLLPTGDGNSDTMDTQEYTAPIRNSKLLIKNMRISIIDGPGLEDTCNHGIMPLVCHRKFIETHPQLQSVKPNLIMIIHNIMDIRPESQEQTSSDFIRVLKSIRGSLLRRIMDPNRPCVVIVLTHQESIPRGDLKTKIATVKSLAHEFLGISDAPVIPVENYPEKNENEDHIGKEAISYFFSEAAHAQITKGYFVLGSSIRALSWPQQINPNENEIHRMLRESFENFEFKHKLPKSCPASVSQYLADKGITAPGHLPDGEGFLKLFKFYPKVNQTMIDFVAQSLGAEVPPRNPIDVKVGTCYNIFKDSFNDAIIYQLGDSKYQMWSRLNIPEAVKIYEENKTLTRCLEFSSIEEYMQKRWEELNVDMGIPSIPALLNKVKVRSGYHISDAQNKSSSSRTILIERHVFSLTAPGDPKLSTEFQRAVDLLPNIYDPSDSGNTNKWRVFFDRFGTHVVKSAYAGGSCTVTVNTSAPKFNKEKLNSFMLDLEDRFGGHEFSSKTKSDKYFNTATIEMQGGNPNFHCRSLQQMNAERIKDWFESILIQPVVLTTTLNLMSLQYIVGQYRPELADAFGEAFDGLFGCHTKSMLAVPIETPATESESVVMTAVSRKDATDKSSPNIKPELPPEVNRNCTIL